MCASQQVCRLDVRQGKISALHPLAGLTGKILPNFLLTATAASVST
jgi:hypothetical protein